MKLYSTSLPIREMKLKPQWDITTNLSEWLKQKILMIPKADEDKEKVDHSNIAGGIVKWYSHSGKSLSFLKK